MSAVMCEIGSFVEDRLDRVGTIPPRDVGTRTYKRKRRQNGPPRPATDRPNGATHRRLPRQEAHPTRSGPPPLLGSHGAHSSPARPPGNRLLQARRTPFPPPAPHPTGPDCGRHLAPVSTEDATDSLSPEPWPRLPRWPGSLSLLQRRPIPLGFSQRKPGMLVPLHRTLRRSFSDSRRSSTHPLLSPTRQGDCRALQGDRKPANRCPDRLP